MVYFVCEGCQETLKKNQVDNHAGRCRNCWAVSCVDCSKVFEGDSYSQHTSCISEAEKYEKSVYKGPKPSKKRNPQEEWMDIISEAAAEVKGPNGKALSNIVRTWLPRMADMGNVPRNEKKFKNFLQNSLRVRLAQDQAALWSFLEERRKQLKASEEEAAAAQQASASEAPAKEEEKQNGHAEEPAAEEEKPKKDKKKKRAEVEEGEKEGQGQEEAAPKKKKQKKQADQDEEHAAEANGHAEADWGAAIKKIVKKAEGRQMSVKQLRKALVQQAASEGRALPQDKKALKQLVASKVEELSCLTLEAGVVSYSKTKATAEQ